MDQERAEYAKMHEGVKVNLVNRDQVNWTSRSKDLKEAHAEGLGSSKNTQIPLNETTSYGLCIEGKKNFFFHFSLFLLSLPSHSLCLSLYKIKNTTVFFISPENGSHMRSSIVFPRHVGPPPTVVGSTKNPKFCQKLQIRFFHPHFPESKVTFGQKSL